jgi:ribosomal protein S18 acetylase RimI-like enzyme
VIRRLVREDRDAVLELLEATGSFSGAELAIAAELIDTTLEDPAGDDYHAFVAENTVPGEPGVSGMLIIGPTPATVGTWDLYWIAAHPRCQGSGVAQVLDAFAGEYVRDRGGYLLVAETSGQASYARARAFYVKQRYEELARIPDYYKPADDLVVFGRRL